MLKKNALFLHGGFPYNAILVYRLVFILTTESLTDTQFESSISQSMNFDVISDLIELEPAHHHTPQTRWPPSSRDRNPIEALHSAHCTLKMVMI